MEIALVYKLLFAAGFFMLFFGIAVAIFPLFAVLFLKTAVEKNRNQLKTEDNIMGKELVRNTRGGILGGVLQGMSDYFSINVSFLRLSFLFLLVLGVGIPLFLYLIAWAVLPDA